MSGETHFDWRFQCLAFVACEKPVHQLLIQIFTLKVFNGFLACIPNIIRRVIRVVQLAGHPHVFPADFALFQDTSKAFANHFLVAVVRSTVEMPACKSSRLPCYLCGTSSAHFHEITYFGNSKQAAIHRTTREEISTRSAHERCLCSPVTDTQSSLHGIHKLLVLSTPRPEPNQWDFCSCVYRRCRIVYRGVLVGSHAEFCLEIRAVCCVCLLLLGFCRVSSDANEERSTFRGHTADPSLVKKSEHAR